MENNELHIEAIVEQEVIEQPKKKLSKEKIRLLCFAGIALFLVICVLVICLYIKADKVSNALEPDAYDRVQIKISQDITYLKSEAEQQEEPEDFSNQQILGEDGAIYGDEGYSYDENGNLVTDNAEDGQAEQQNTTENYTLSTIVIDGDTVYEDSSFGKYYCYTRDNERYVTYFYQDFVEIMGLEEEEAEKVGEWVEVYESNYGSMLSFDTALLTKYKASDFKKQDDYYIPKQNEQEMFFELLQIRQKENYKDCAIKFYFEQGRLIKIVANYVYGDTMEIAQTYAFSYENTAIKVPKAEKRYDINGELIEE